MFNVYVNDGNLKEFPSDSICYIVAKGGIYLKKELDNISSLTKVNKVDCLEELQSYAKLNLPKIPAEKFARIVDFFRKVYDEHRSEGVVILYLNPENKNIRIVVPKQEVGGASADYDADFTVENYERIGTIHSHANFGAFHSGIDTNDEENFDGLHITVGNVADKAVSISSCVVVNGERFKVAPEDYIDGIHKPVSRFIESYKLDKSSKKSWKKNKKKWNKKEFKNQKKYFGKLFKFNFESKDETEKEDKFKSSFSSFAADRYECESDSQCNTKWLRMVSKKEFKYSYAYRGSKYNGMYGGKNLYGAGYKKTYPGKNFNQPSKKFSGGVELERKEEDGVIYYQPTKEERGKALTPVDARSEFKLEEDKRELITEIPCNKCVHRLTKMELEIEELTEEEDNISEELLILKDAFPDASMGELIEMQEAMDSLDTHYGF